MRLITFYSFSFFLSLPFSFSFLFQGKCSSFFLMAGEGAEILIFFLGGGGGIPQKDLRLAGLFIQTCFRYIFAASKNRSWLRICVSIVFWATTWYWHPGRKCDWPTFVSIYNYPAAPELMEVRTILISHLL